MEEVHDDVVESTTVKTIRKIKSKRDSLSKTMNPSDLKDTFTKGDTPIEDKSSTAKSTDPKATKKAKTINYVDENGEFVVSDNAQSKEKENVFRRLAKGKTLSLSKDSRKKNATPQAQVNFFDNQYKSSITVLIDIIVSKSKEIKDFMEVNSMSRGYINKYILEDQHFLLCFTGLLDRMLKAGEITGDLKNLNKQTFTKLEEFIKAKIEARLKLDQIQEALEEHTKSGELMAKKRINDLHNMLKK